MGRLKKQRVRPLDAHDPLMPSYSIRVNGTDLKLKPGMAVTAEVQTGHRRIIEFFMAPLLRAKAESIRER
jgi:hemolysin D